MGRALVPDALGSPSSVRWDSNSPVVGETLREGWPFLTLNKLTRTDSLRQFLAERRIERIEHSLIQGTAERVVGRQDFRDEAIARG